MTYNDIMRTIVTNIYIGVSHGRFRGSQMLYLFTAIGFIRLIFLGWTLFNYIFILHNFYLVIYIAGYTIHYNSSPRNFSRVGVRAR